MKVNKKLKIIFTIIFLSLYLSLIVACKNQEKPINSIDTNFQKTPEKVLAVYQNSIEILLALGLEDKIIAASGLDHAVKSEYSEAFSKLNYLTDFTPDKETVTMIKPDFILSWNSLFNEKRLGNTDYWHERGVNTYIMLNSGISQERILRNEYEDILNIGKIFDVEDKAEKIVDEIKTEVEKVIDHASSYEQKKKVLIIEFESDNIRVYGKTSLVGDMAISLGADLITEKTNSIGQEDLILLNPDVIFVVYMDKDSYDISDECVDKIIEQPKFASLKAVVNKNVYPIKLGEVYCSGIRTIDGIKNLANGIYPELYKKR